MPMLFHLESRLPFKRCNYPMLWVIAWGNWNGQKRYIWMHRVLQCLSVLVFVQSLEKPCIQNVDIHFIIFFKQLYSSPCLLWQIRFASRIPKKASLSLQNNYIRQGKINIKRLCKHPIYTSILQGEPRSTFLCSFSMLCCKVHIFGWQTFCINARIDQAWPIWGLKLYTWGIKVQKLLPLA